MEEKTPLKFYRGSEAPQTLTKGTIWFDTAVNVIKVYTGSDWEKYGKVQDVTFQDLVLTVTKSDGSTFSLNFTDVASATGTNATFEKLTNRLAAIEKEIDDNLTSLQSAIGDVDDKVDNLDTRVGFPAQGGINVGDQNVTTVVAYVDAKVAAENKAAADAIQDVADALAEEVTRATGVEADLQQQITTNKNAIDVLNGDAVTEGSVKKQVADAVASLVNDAPESFDTLKEIADWIAEGEVNGDTATLVADVREAQRDIAALEELMGGTVSVSDQITNAINNLDSNVTATAEDDGKVGVLTGVTQTDGKLTDKNESFVYTVDKTDALLAAETEAREADVDTLTNNLAKEVQDRINAINQEVTDRNTAIKDAVEALDSDYVPVVDDVNAGTVAVMTALEIKDGKISADTNSKTAKVDVYTTAKVDSKITNALDALDFEGVTEDTPNNGTSVIATVTQDNGKISATAVEVEKAGAAAQALEDAMAYIDEQVAGKNVSAEGDAYVSASAVNNKVTISTNIDEIREYVLTWEEF